MAPDNDCVLVREVVSQLPFGDSASYVVHGQRPNAWHHPPPNDFRTMRGSAPEVGAGIFLTVGLRWMLVAFPCLNREKLPDV